MLRHRLFTLALLPTLLSALAVNLASARTIHPTSTVPAARPGFETNFTFDGQDGALPDGDLIVWNGALYGTATSGGPLSGNGGVFSLTQTPRGLKPAWLGDATEAQSPLIVQSGLMYGAARSGGAFGAGYIFAVDPRLPAVTDIYDFTGTAVDGGYPDGGLLWVAGRLYGTAPLGGTTTCFQTYYGVPNCGEIFALTPPVNGQTHWSFAALHEFAGPPDGWQPNGHLLLYSGMIVGMTEIGGYYESGTAFAISPDGRNYQQFFSFPLVSFPFRGFIAVGTTLLGTTEEGGNGWGNVFKLTPQGRGRFAYASLYSFSFGSGGSYPLGTLLALTRGPSPGAVAPGGFDPLANVTLYGTTACCGGNNGTVFKLTPPRPATGPNAQWTATTEWDFTSGADGSNPQGSLVFWNGLLYGTTPTANNLNTGTVFSTTL